MWFFTLLAIIMSTLCICTLAGCICTLAGKIRNLAGKIRNQNTNDLQDKPVEEMTPAEKAKKLRLIEQMFEHGQLTFQQYDVIKAKYTGEKSLTEEWGLGYVGAISDKFAADQAVKKHNEQAQKRIITNAAVGNAIGGIAGGVAAASAVSHTTNMEAAQLLMEQERANEKLKNAKFGK